MRILMIAPQPFFEARGTPFSEYHRIRALADLGHSVDLVTYPFGRDVSLPGLRLHRSWRPPFVGRVRIGPSLAKIPLDLLLAVKALHVGLKWKFDYVHSHEEGGAIGLVLSRLLRVPHLYDMHSSLPEQLSNFKFSRSRLLVGAFRMLERLMVSRSASIIVICRHLEEVVRATAPDAHVVLIENAPGSGNADGGTGGVDVRAFTKMPAGAPLVLYTGTFEAYQGLDLLFASMKRVLDQAPDARLVLAGGHAGPDRTGATRRGRAGHRRRDGVRRRAPGRGNPVLSRGGRRAGLAPEPRQEHAAQDLPVPPERQADRGDEPADPHAGARRRRWLNSPTRLPTRSARASFA